MRQCHLVTSLTWFFRSSLVHVSLSVPLGSILIIARTISVFLLRSGGESIFPSITKNLLFAPQFLFWIVVWNSPVTPRSDWRVFSVSLLGPTVVLWFPLICILGLWIILVLVHHVHTCPAVGFYVHVKISYSDKNRVLSCTRSQFLCLM